MALKIRTDAEKIYDFPFGGAKFSGRILTERELNKLRNQFKKKPKFGRQEDGTLDDVGTAKFLQARFVAQITSWEDVIDSNEKAIPCTDENKEIFYDLNVETALEILAELNKLGQSEDVDPGKN